MVRAARSASVGLAILLLITACTSSSDTTTTSTTSPAITTLPESTTTSVASETTTTLPPVNPLEPPEYQIVSRTPIEGQGDEVVVLLDPTTYDSLTDLDLYDIIAEVVDQFPPVTVMHVVDDPSAANVVVNPDASEAERVVLDDHYLARLDGGFTITYLGPFSSSGSAVLGS